MVQFGRVEGVASVVVPVVAEAPICLALTVTLETNHRVEIVRAEHVPGLRTITDQRELDWQVDQWTQETIGVDLAEQGWEVIGSSESEAAMDDSLGRSAVYAVRKL